jgi:hypothetical protein
MPDRDVHRRVVIEGVGVTVRINARRLYDDALETARQSGWPRPLLAHAVVAASTRPDAPASLVRQVDLARVELHMLSMRPPSSPVITVAADELLAFLVGRCIDPFTKMPLTPSLENLARHLEFRLGPGRSTGTLS